jgi:hypothetical protein
MKKTIIDRSRSERGQVLVIVALVFVGLVALAGLAIDGGNLFVQRRQAQNASDAATLAGTRLVAKAIQTCDSVDTSAVDDEIDRTINDYAEKNGISDTNGVAGDEVNDNVIGYYVSNDGTDLGQVGEVGDLPLGTCGVRVAVSDRDKTFFMPLIGIKEIPSSAQAMALTGPVTQLAAGGPLLPIAVPDIVVEEIAFADNPEWEMHDTQDGEFCYTPEGGTEVCIDDPGASHNAQRGWLNLNHIFNDQYLEPVNDGLNRTFDQAIGTGGCPNDPDIPPQDQSDLAGLAGYASGECGYPLPIHAGHQDQLDEDWIHGSSGARTSGVRAIYEAFKNNGGAVAPVFDVAYLREEMVATFPDQAESPDGFPNGGGFSSAGGGAGDAYYYHIVGFVYISGDYADKDNHVVHATFSGVFINGGIQVGEGWDGSGSCELVAYGINLVR